MKIWVDDFIFNYEKTGISSFLETILEILNKENINYELTKFRVARHIKFKHYILLFWFNTILYIKTLIEKPDIILFPNFFMPFVKRKGTKYICVIHDLSALNSDYMPDKYWETLYAYATKNGIKNADTIITVSNTVKNEIIQQFKIRPNKVNVVYNVFGKQFYSHVDDVLHCYGLEKGKYLLSVASFNKRKNAANLFKAFNMISEKYPDIKLVFVGSGNDNKFKVNNKNIILTGYISDNDLVNLYKNALLYIFPSLYEGFGTPVLEAQISQVPLICSDIPVFREIAGDGAEYCKTDDFSIAEKTEYLINNSERRKELIKLGCENLKRFDKKIVTEQFLSVINTKDI